MADVGGRLRGLAQTVSNMMFRGVNMRIVDKGEALVAQVAGRSGEIRDGVMLVYPFGHDAWPAPAGGGHGSEGIVIQLEGNQRIELPPMDRRHRGKSGVKAEDESALYNTKARITIKADGTIELRGLRLDWVLEQDAQITAPGGFKLITPKAEVTGDLLDSTDGGNANTVRAMRTIHNGHDHPETGATTGKANQKM
jgi:phage gp45-like